MTYERILVTGASGFVGTRLCEHLALGHGASVRALIHEPSRAVRVARLDVELVRGDLADEASLEAALDGCDAVVHCAYGTSGSARERRALTGEATRRLAALALARGVRRFVHLSTAAVHGFRPALDEIDESVPTPRSTGHPYADSKLDAERALHAATAAGLPAVILRPTNVFGPWAPAFTIAPVHALRAGAVALVGDGAGPANTVYVDNLVGAIVSALERDEAVGQTFFVSDDDGVTWRRLLESYAALAAPAWNVRGVSLEAYRRAQRPRPGRFVRSLAAELGGVARSPEARALALAAVERPAVRSVARTVLRAVPGGRARARGIGAPAAGVAPSPAPPALPSPELADLQTSGVRFRADKARTLLAWSPAVDFERALELTGAWLRFARLV